MKLNNNDDSHNSGLNLLIYNMLLDIESHPTWVCGLKLQPHALQEVVCKVTPYVGVWIETGNRRIIIVFQSWSHPTWVCGLKLVSCLICLAMVLSHPTWVCGLKRTLLVCYANL